MFMLKVRSLSLLQLNASGVRPMHRVRVPNAVNMRFCFVFVLIQEKDFDQFAAQYAVSVQS